MYRIRRKILNSDEGDFDLFSSPEPKAHKVSL